MKTINDLEKFGFKIAGYWFLTENHKIDFKLEESLFLTKDVLYAFETDCIVKYIGITEQSIKSRMINYKSGHEENKSAGITNRFVNTKIKKLLVNGKNVNIYYLKGEANCSYKGLRISLSTGIEKTLINIFDVEDNLWNSRGVQGNTKYSIDRNNNLKIVQKNSNQTVITLKNESFNKGIINFKNDVDNLLPLESQGIDIHYKNKIISGWFTRSFHNKKINGYSELKQIFTNDFNFGNKILVTILNTNEIRIDKVNAT